MTIEFWIGKIDIVERNHGLNVGIIMKLGSTEGGAG